MNYFIPKVGQMENSKRNMAVIKYAVSESTLIASAAAWVTPRKE